MENGIPVFDWQKPEVVPPNKFKQNPVHIEWDLEEKSW